MQYMEKGLSQILPLRQSLCLFLQSLLLFKSEGGLQSKYPLHNYIRIVGDDTVDLLTVLDLKICAGAERKNGKRRGRIKANSKI